MSQSPGQGVFEVTVLHDGAFDVMRRVLGLARAERGRMVVIVLLSLVSAVFEGFGLSLIIPIALIAMSGGQMQDLPISAIWSRPCSAARRQRVLELGGFDERIGPGAAGGCGDDSEYWSRVLHAGGAIVYEPLSVVRHSHRDSWDDLRRQAYGYGYGYGYGFGHIVALLAQYGRNRDRRDLRRALWTMPVWLAKRGLKAPLQMLLRKPDRLTGPWLQGYAGSLAYLPIAFRPPAAFFLPPKLRSDDE